MEHQRIHSWDMTADRAKAQQTAMRRLVSLDDEFGKINRRDQNARRKGQCRVGNPRVIDSLRGYRLPEPTHQVHNLITPYKKAGAAGL